MAVNLSPVGGVAAQFFDNNGVPLAGGKLYTYAAGTTTPVTAYTSSQGVTAWSNPIILNSAGRVSGSGEIWITDGILYKFVLETSTGVLIATYDNISGINSSFVAFTNQQEIVTATAGQTVFNLGISYQPGTNSLSVFVDGVNQYGPGAQYAYTETDSDTVTFTSGLHVGADVKFTTTQQQGAGVVDASQVTYDPPFTGSVATNVEAKLAQTVSVTDFGAVGDGVADDTAAFTAMVSAVNAVPLSNNPVGVYFPQGKYRYSATLGFDRPVSLFADCDATLDYTGNSFAIRLGPLNLLNSPSAFAYQEMTVDGLRFTGGADAVHGIYISDSVFEPRIRNCVFDDFGSPTNGSVYCIWGQANNWNTLIENCRMFVQNRPSASGVNFIAINGVSTNGVSDGGNSRVTIRDCWMTAYNPGNFLGAFALINAVDSQIIGGGFQVSSRGILVRPGAGGTVISRVYCEIYTDNSSFIEVISDTVAGVYYSPQNVKVQDCYINFHASDGITNARAIRPFDGTARLLNWSIDNMIVANIEAGQIIVEQNNLSGQTGNNFCNIFPLFIPKSTDDGSIRPNFPQILSNVEPWANRTAGGSRNAAVSFTLNTEDTNRTINCTGSGITITVPPSGALPFIPVGSYVELFNSSVGSQTIAQGSGVSLIMPSGAANRTLASNGFALLKCIAPDVWAVTGTGVS